MPQCGTIRRTRPGTVFEPGALVMVPLPFSGLSSTKRRPVLALTAPDPQGHFRRRPTITALVAVWAAPSRHGRPCAGHPRLAFVRAVKAWMAGTRPAMTGRISVPPIDSFIVGRRLIACPITSREGWSKARRLLPEDLVEGAFPLASWMRTDKVVTLHVGLVVRRFGRGGGGSSRRSKRGVPLHRCPGGRRSSVIGDLRPGGRIVRPVF